MTVFIVKLNVIDGVDIFINEIETGAVSLFFKDGGYAQATEPDWNEIEDMIRSKKI